jgi:hypothetical protein
MVWRSLTRTMQTSPFDMPVMRNRSTERLEPPRLALESSLEWKGGLCERKATAEGKRLGPAVVSPGAVILSTRGDAWRSRERAPKRPGDKGVQAQGTKPGPENGGGAPERTAQRGEDVWAKGRGRRATGKLEGGLAREGPGAGGCRDQT